MLWHIVSFRFRDEVGPTERSAFAAQLRALADAIPSLRLLRVAPAVDDADRLGLLTGFDDLDGFVAYRDHPEHLPVLARAKELCADIWRLDVATDDPADALPLR